MKYFLVINFIKVYKFILRICSRAFKFIRNLRNIHLILFIFLSANSIFSKETEFDEWMDLKKSPEIEKFKDWMKCKLSEELGIPVVCEEFPLKSPPGIQGRFGVFITLVKRKKVRGCYGSFYPQSDDLESIIIAYIRGASKNDPRYEPLFPSEAPDTKIIVTIAAMPFPTSDPGNIDFKKYGIIITEDSGTKKVYVPAEIKSSSFLEKNLKRSREEAIFRAISL
jgi:hypothetical protein